MKNISLISTLFFLSLLFFMMCHSTETEDKIKKQNADLQFKKDSINAEKAKIILSKDFWYIVNTHILSSEKDGKGVVVRLDGNEEIKGRGNRLKIYYPGKNQQMIFIPISSPNNFGTAYTICGGLLTYDYVKN